MLNKSTCVFILVSTYTCFFNIEKNNAQRCQVIDAYQNGGVVNDNSNNLIKRTTYSFQIVFHILYTNEEENIGSSQILSQMEILNKIYHHEVNSENINIPLGFRHLIANPDISFCLAEKDPQGKITNGITRTKISDISIACKQFLGKRSIMHSTLGGLDIWNPSQYINVYIVNRDQCNVLGEAIFPWNASDDEDGIIIDYRATGFIGAASYNNPFHQGKTLVHEMGHYFGLKHLSNDLHDCNGDDLVADTPPQSTEYFGCPNYPQISCGTINLTMNYMSLVNDACMQLFTKGQVERMHLIIEQYKKALLENPCIEKPISTIDKLIWIYNLSSWQIKNPDNLPWSAQLELFDISGKLIWIGEINAAISISIPQVGMMLFPGIYFLRITQDSQNKIIKLIKYS